MALAPSCQRQPCDANGDGKKQVRLDDCSGTVTEVAGAAIVVRPVNDVKDASKENLKTRLCRTSRGHQTTQGFPGQMVVGCCRVGLGYRVVMGQSCGNITTISKCFQEPLASPRSPLAESGVPAGVRCHESRANRSNTDCSVTICLG